MCNAHVRDCVTYDCAYMRKCCCEEEIVALEENLKCLSHDDEQESQKCSDEIEQNIHKLRQKIAGYHRIMEAHYLGGLRSPNPPLGK